MSSLFNELLHDFDHPAWEDESTPNITLAEIQFLCRALGAPKSGTKERVWVRLCAIRQVRAKISKYHGDAEIESLVNDFPKISLRRMAKEAGVWRSGNKRQLAITLLNWRTRARQQGSAFVQEQFAQAKKQPHQLALF
jgi:hypothetical protein